MSTYHEFSIHSRLFEVTRLTDARRPALGKVKHACDVIITLCGIPLPDEIDVVVCSEGSGRSQPEPKRFHGCGTVRIDTARVDVAMVIGHIDASWYTGILNRNVLGRLCTKEGGQQLE